MARKKGRKRREIGQKERDQADKEQKERKRKERERVLKELREGTQEEIDHPLKGTMELKTMVKATYEELSIIQWLLKANEILETGVLFFQHFERNDFQCACKLIRTEKFLCVALRLCYTNVNTFFYMDNGVITSHAVHAKEIRKGLYIAEFPCGPDQEDFFSKARVLKFVFRLTVNVKIWGRENSYGQIGVSSDVDCLGSEMKLSYLLSVHTDFTIGVRNQLLKTHKWILAARSKFFEEYFQKYEEASCFTVTETSPDIMREVLMYVYSGELPHLDADRMVKVIIVAYLLRIQSLEKRCYKYFVKTGSTHILRKIQFWNYAVE